MSSNSGVIINRSNETSPFFQALASRNSKSLPELYSAEVNTESAAQSVVEVESSSSAGYGRTLRIELPRYGLLNKLYLHTRFGPSTGTPAVAKFTQQIPFIGAMCIREARIMYNGAVLQKTDGFSIVADMWKNSSEVEKKHLQELLGAFDATSSPQLASVISGTVATDADKYSETIARRCINSAVTGNHNDGVQDFYCPLDYYFSAKHSPNRALDLSVLSSPCVLEIDMESQDNLFKATDAQITANPALLNVSAMCYLTELDLEVEKNYRALSYQAGGSPLTQLAFNSERVVVSTGITHGAPDQTIDVKLNQFTGNVYKLVVYAVLADNFPTNLHRIRPGSIKEIQLKATGTNIVNQDNLHEKEGILESYHCGGNYNPVGSDLQAEFSATAFAAVASTTTRAQLGLVGNQIRTAIAGAEWSHNITCNPQNFYEINFKKPYDMSKVSNSGSISVGQLSVPSLRMKLAGSTSNGQFGAQPNVLGAAVDIHVIAYSTSLVSYNTNSSGSTSIRMIQN